MLRALGHCAAFLLLGHATVLAEDVARPLERVDAALVQSLPPTPAKECCKVCRKGKACGDTCIARDKECRTPPGCACDG